MQYKVRITGRSPLVMHSNRCVDPLDPLTKEIKAITGKRKKTDADHEQIRWLEFQGGIYHSEATGPFIPSNNIRKMLIEAGRKSKDGKQFESGCWVLEDAPVQYDGPKGVRALYEAGFAWTCVVGNQRNSIMRTRPRFNEWSAVFDALVDETLVSPEMMTNALHHAQTAVGLLDGRSVGMGRFYAEVIPAESQGSNGRVKRGLQPV